MDNDALIEEIAACIHADWSGDLPLMPPYADVSESLKKESRSAAKAALTGIERAGYRLIKDAGVRSYPTT